MSDVRTVASIAEIGRERWDALFPGELERFDYLLATEQAGLAGFRWLYLIAEDEGRLLAAAPAFLTEYALDTTLTGAGKRAAAAVRKLAPGLLTLRMACFGSPCTESAQVGFAPDMTADQRAFLLRAVVGAFERAARDERCALLAVKDVPEAARPLWEQALKPAGYHGVAGLPVAHLDIAFDSVETYLAGLSSGTRKDMRRKLRALGEIRIETRRDLDGVLDRVVELYRATLERAEMTFEELTPAFFTGVLERMGEGAFCTLYYAGDELLAANLLLQDDEVLLDKFFCMTAQGRAYNLYFLSWFTNVRWCVEHGLARYQSGQAAYANKLRLGSRLTRTTMYVRHRNPVLNGVLHWVAPLFAADPTLEKAA
ncbi:MAG: GNAT family N-acetyltransferase [Caulobacteraceae bacterium]|nr:GNAT family N-acetyltransferase [Caulobacteraceae bacterium]